LKEWTTPDSRNTPSTTNLEEEETVDAPGNDGNTSMPEQVKRPNPWRKMIMIFLGMALGVCVFPDVSPECTVFICTSHRCVMDSCDLAEARRCFETSGNIHGTKLRHSLEWLETPKVQWLLLNICDLRNVLLIFALKEQWLLYEPQALVAVKETSGSIMVPSDTWT
jgi:hypothetical protein